MAKYKILYWHDIPVHVRAEDKNGRASAKLPDRFQEAIDDAAMSANLISDEDYTEGFQWGQEHERRGSASEVAESLAAELDLKYTQIDWKATAAKLKGK